jgi:long-subunit fatty acid transport protein
MRVAGRALLLALIPALLPAAARAGGYDTPMLYSARHMGMGGAAIGYVDDASSLFHNPAGLAHTGSWSVIGDLSVLLAKVRSSPQLIVKDVESKQTVAPLFLVGGALRLNEIVTVGLGVYPIALAGATYEYPQVTGAAGSVEDRTRLVFLEASPAVAFNLPYHLRLGAGYRVTYVSIERFRGVPSDPAVTPFLDFNMSGLNWAGFRLGAQWTPVPWLQIGAVYRHKTSTKVKNDSGVAVAMTYTDISTTFVLPTRAGLGARADFWNFGVAVDGEYTFNSQNDAFPLIGLEPGATTPSAVPNVFAWKNEITLRGGLEYRLARVKVLERLALRGGYVFDGKSTNEVYSSAFGTPPGPTHVVTGGLGWNGGAWRLNVAYARRFGTGAVTPADIAARGTRTCQFCGYAGDKPYKIAVDGLYLDLSFAY